MTPEQLRVLEALRDHTAGPLTPTEVAARAVLPGGTKQAAVLLYNLPAGLVGRVTVRDFEPGDRVPTRWWYLTAAGRVALMPE